MITTNKKPTLDYIALAIFFPAVIAMAIIPTLIRVTVVISDSVQMKQLFSDIDISVPGAYGFVERFSQVKGFAVAIIAVVMLALAFFCCLYLFKGIEKRSFVYVGASVVYVIMTLASALGSPYSDVAFYGIFDRAEGFFTLACYFVMFLFTMYAFKKTQNFSVIVLALMICTTVNLVIGLFQYFGNDLIKYEWFRDLVFDHRFEFELDYDVLAATQKQQMYGALYHYNYMGSFAGMIVPLFTVLAFTSKKLVYRIVTAIFALISIFMLLAGEARSGFVAVAVAAVVGIIVFARVLIRRWKITVSVLAAALVAVVGVNFATDNSVFDRIPSLLEDIGGLITPAEQTDMFANLPVREITHNKNGSVSFTTQTDVLTLTFDSESKEYVFTDAAGEVLPTEETDKGITIADEDFSGLNFELISSDEELGYSDFVGVWFNDNTESALSFYLFKEDDLHMINLETGRRDYPVNADSIGFEGKEKLGSSRGYIWSRTLPLLSKCFITGYGPDTFPFVFPQNDYLAKYYAYSEGFDITVDKPHNLYLQIFFSSGLIALIAFLAICVFYLVDCFRLYALKKTYRSEQCFGISVMLAIVGYLAAGMFNDSVVSVAPVFWILLGTGAALNTINRRMDKQECEAAAAAEKALQKEQAAAKPKPMVQVMSPNAPSVAAAPKKQIPHIDGRRPTEAEFIAAMEVLINKAKTSPDGNEPTEAQLRAIMNAALNKNAQGEQTEQPSQGKTDIEPSAEGEEN
ncbi:MAG: O-antigen ligase family protein [Oscillospiraceae bacterium]|nr:O-antigen ligase family protein [Oscillospiraceae bacterium]